ncbi:MAG: hypothetical protein A3E80_03370 [Chlamydiae bacterium RIFCSPHIGHO2_12_FULL_49_9]|nr:MAG: hypothetical protein A3E80_03370 [Chlamydiae bacterium RIFCSPHIGHO2_12_FULL_49_9]
MAKHQKNQSPPASIEAPKALVPLMLAFHVDSEKEAKALLEEAAYAIYGREAEPESGFEVFKKKRVISKDELEGILSLMKCINPRDSLETLFAAQIVVSHMLGMRRLAKGCREDQKLGLNLLRFSNEAMQQLVKKRGGGMQNITVNYNYNGQQDALMQTVLPEERRLCQFEG